MREAESKRNERRRVKEAESERDERRRMGNAESERNEQRRVREAESERRCASEGDRKQATASEEVNGGMDGWRTAFAL